MLHKTIVDATILYFHLHVWDLSFLYSCKLYMAHVHRPGVSSSRATWVGSTPQACNLRYWRARQENHKTDTSLGYMRSSRWNNISNNSHSHKEPHLNSIWYTQFSLLHSLKGSSPLKVKRMKGILKENENNISKQIQCNRPYEHRHNLQNCTKLSISEFKKRLYLAKSQVYQWMSIHAYVKGHVFEKE